MPVKDKFKNKVLTFARNTGNYYYYRYRYRYCYRCRIIITQRNATRKTSTTHNSFF